MCDTCVLLLGSGQRLRVQNPSKTDRNTITDAGSCRRDRADRWKEQSERKGESGPGARDRGGSRMNEYLFRGQREGG